MPNIMYEMIANRLIIDRATTSDSSFAAQYAAAWQRLYPHADIPEQNDCLAKLQPCTRTILELGDIRKAAADARIAFVLDRLLRYHAARLLERSSESIAALRKAVAAELESMGFFRLDAGLNALLDAKLQLYAWPQNPQQIYKNEARSFGKSLQLLAEMHRWLLQQFNQAGGRRRSERRRESPEAKEEKTLRRIQGQLAIDLMMMTREAAPQEDNPDVEDFALEQFLAACGNSSMYKDFSPEYCEKLWRAALNEDRILYEHGSLMSLVDSRMGIICTRCLMLAMARVPEGQETSRDEVIQSACELMEVFQLEYTPEELKKNLLHWTKFYLVEKQVLPSVLKLLREHRDIVEDAYEMYAEQSQAELERRRQEIDERVALLHANDRLQYREEQRANTLQHIREFTCIENGAILGWLCMASHGMPYEQGQMRYYLEGMMQKLKALGLEPIATEKIGVPFQGEDEGTEGMLDLSGQPLQSGVQYQLVQLGWKYQGETVVCPKAARVQE